MSHYQQGQNDANKGTARPIAGSDTARQQRQKGYDDQMAKIAKSKG